MPDELSEGFWRAAAAHVLAIQRCVHCERYSHPPVRVCPGCLSTPPAFCFDPVSGRGTIRTWTIMRDAFLPSFRDDVPYAVADVELPEQHDLRIIGLMVDGADAPYEIGAQVEVVFEDIADGAAVPHFRLVTGRP